MDIFKKFLFFTKFVIYTQIFSFLFSEDNYYKLSLNYFPSKSSLWWQNNNNYGNSLIGPQVSFSVKSNFHKIIFSHNSTFNQNEKKLIIKELSLTYNARHGMNIKSGMFKRDFSNYLNDDLSSGSLLISNNAEPIPKISLLWSKNFKKSLLISLGISHGLFDKNEFYSKPPFLHEKFIYLIRKYNNSELGVGLVHEAMWGGTTIQGKHPGRQPSSPKDFLKVFLSTDGPLREGEPHANALGNHLGIWDFYYVKKFSNNSVKLYYQHLFEDTSSLRFANKTDGLWGIEFSTNNIHGLLEYINTSNACNNPPYQCDNYYWNYQYASGWRYKGYIIGSPLINPRNSIYIDKIKVIHLGGKLNFNSFQLTLLAFRNTNENDKLKAFVGLKRNLSKKNSTSFLFFKDGNKSNLGIETTFEL